MLDGKQHREQQVMSALHLLAVFAENKTGQLARVTRVLANAGLSIRWVTIASSEAFGVIKLLVDQTGTAYARLKEEGLPVSTVEVLALDVEDKPGGLSKVAEVLARNQVNIDNASAFVVSGRTVLLLEVKDAPRARELLALEQIFPLSAEEVGTL